MLNFDEERYLGIVTKTVETAGPIRELIGTLLNDKGIDNIFFLGAGGAGTLLGPASQLLNRNSGFPSFHDYPAELMETDSKRIGAGTLVVMPSLSGTTQESVDSLEWLKAKGATTLTLTGYADTPLAQQADHNFTVYAADDTSSEVFYLESLFIALAIMDVRGEIDNYDALIKEFAALPKALLETKRAFEPRAEELAEQHQDTGYHIFTGAGNAFYEAYYFAMCIVEEMQWIRTRPVHAHDFFHGTLELVEKGVSIVALLGEDSARALGERVVNFAPRVTDTLSVIDTKDFALDGLSDQARGLVSPVVLAAALERFAVQLERARRHPLEVRRYYKRLKY